MVWRDVPFAGVVSLSGGERLRPAPGDGDLDNWCDLGCGSRTGPGAFLKVLADRLDVAVTTGEATGLTMVASPRALGMIRSDYSVAVRKALRGELDKDLVKMPVHEIEKQLPV